MLDKQTALEHLIAHIDAHHVARQKAKDTKQKYVPSPVDMQERDRLLVQFLAAVGFTRTDLIHQLSINRATWDRWRNMTTMPQRVHIEALARIAQGFIPYDAQRCGNILIANATEAMLNALGMTKQDLETLEWLERIESTAGQRLTKEACMALIASYKPTNRESGS